MNSPPPGLDSSKKLPSEKSQMDLILDGLNFLTHELVEIKNGQNSFDNKLNDIGSKIATLESRTGSKYNSRSRTPLQFSSPIDFQHKLNSSFVENQVVNISTEYSPLIVNASTLEFDQSLSLDKSLRGDIPYVSFSSSESDDLSFVASHPSSFEQTPIPSSLFDRTVLGTFIGVWFSKDNSFEDLLKSSFGDHLKVVVNPSGVLLAWKPIQRVVDLTVRFFDPGGGSGLSTPTVEIVEERVIVIKQIDVVTDSERSEQNERALKIHLAIDDSIIIACNMTESVYTPLSLSADEVIQYVVPPNTQPMFVCVFVLFNIFDV
jgi:hypothetical protein